jgi:hypothetical protein
MARKQLFVVLIAIVLAAVVAGASVPKKHIAFTDYLNSQYGVQHINGPGDYAFDDGGTLPLRVTNTVVLTKALRIKNVPNGEHLLLRHIKGDRFEVVHEASGQKAALRLQLVKGGN